MAQVKAVPAGYHSVTPFLNIKGAAKAIEFYQKAFGAEEHSRMSAPDGTVAHAEIAIGDSKIMLSEAAQRPATNSSLMLYVADADAMFGRALAAGAQVVMPLADQFWGDRYGLVSDPFGNTWSIATHVEDVAPDEMQRRAKAWMASQK